LREPKYEAGSPDTHSDCETKDPENVRSAAVVNKARETHFGVGSGRSKDARILRIRDGLGEIRGGGRLGRQFDILRQILRGHQLAVGPMLDEERASFPGFHVNGWRIFGAKDGTHWKNEVCLPNSGEDHGKCGVIKNAMEGGRDIVGQLENLFVRVRNTKIPQPDKVAPKGGAVKDGGIFQDPTRSARIGDLSVRVAVVLRRDRGRGIDAEAGFCVIVLEGDTK